MVTGNQVGCRVWGVHRTPFIDSDSMQSQGLITECTSYRLTLKSFPIARNAEFSAEAAFHPPYRG